MCEGSYSPSGITNSYTLPVSFCKSKNTSHRPCHKKTAKILAIEQIKFKRLCLYSWCSRLCGPQYLISNDFMLMNESIGSHLKKTCIVVQNI